MDLTKKKCVPCESGAAPLGGAEIKKYVTQLKNGWEVLNDKKLRREFKFKNFKEALAFVNVVAATAENEGHHPDLHIFYNKVVVELWTHSIGGLSENDFILAAKIDTV